MKKASAYYVAGTLGAIMAAASGEPSQADQAIVSVTSSVTVDEGDSFSSMDSTASLSMTVANKMSCLEMGKNAVLTSPADARVNLTCLNPEGKARHFICLPLTKGAVCMPK